MRVQVRVHFHYSLAKAGQQQPRGRKFGVTVDILPPTPPQTPHTPLPRASYLEKLRLDALLSLEGWEIPLRKIKIISKRVEP